MDDNSETVARLYNRLAQFHGSGHVPIAAAPEPPEAIRSVEVHPSEDTGNVTPELTAESLDTLRAIAGGEARDGAHNTEVTFEVVGGAPGERYLYRVGVSGDGTGERRSLDELVGGEELSASGTVQPELATRVFAAARDAGLLDDSSPGVPGEPEGQIVPDSLVAIITVRDGDSLRRVVLPAADPAIAAEPSTESADVPLDTDVRLPSESTTAMQPLLEALRAVEAAL
jgi:hypothetical protein